MKRAQTDRRSPAFRSPGRVSTHFSPAPAWVRSLLRHFGRTRRDLPWRRNTDPYRVWVSEIMLQQTQVAAVVPYYGRFLARFPTLRSLARAKLHDVLRAWEGLGYYSRARNLHRAAREIVARHGGRLPDSVEGLRALPGIGAYTAAAVASICFGRPVPCVDGNFVRVFARFFGLHGDSRAPRFRTVIAERVQPAMPADAPGDFNQAVMELGATVCKPRNPGCTICPLRRWCVAWRTGRVERFPERSRRKRTPHFDVVACVIRRGPKVLIAQRRPDQMLGGLWEFPGGKCKPGETLEDAAVREIREEIGIAIEPLRRLTAIDHAYSHFRITLHAVECRYVSGRARPIECAAVRWVMPEQFEDFPFPVTDRRIVKRLRM